MGKEWIRIKEVGQLFLEKILVSFDIPILFVCVDYENRKYLCLNIDDESGKSVIVATDNKYLISMLTNKISMDSVFQNSIDGKIIVAEYNYEKEEIVSYTEDAKKIPSDMLPKENAYFELINKVIEEYISYLERQLIKIEFENFSETKSFTVRQSGNFTNFAAGDMMAYSSESVIVAETLKKCSYHIKENNRMIA